VQTQVMQVVYEHVRQFLRDLLQVLVEVSDLLLEAQNALGKVLLHAHVVAELSNHIIHELDNFDRWDFTVDEVLEAQGPHSLNEFVVLLVYVQL